MYYFVGIILFVVMMILQLSMGEFLRMGQIKPSLLIIPLVFFSLKMRPKFLSDSFLRQSPVRMVRMKFQGNWAGWGFPKELPMEDAFKAAMFGLVAGFIEGVNSGSILSCMTSWIVAGFLIGLVAGSVNRKSRIVKILSLFIAAIVQGVIFFVFLLFSSPFYPLHLVVQNVLLSALYTTLIGMPLLVLLEKKNEDRVVEAGA